MRGPVSRADRFTGFWTLLIKNSACRKLENYPVSREEERDTFLVASVRKR
jgi:hypothetical protein